MMSQQNGLRDFIILEKGFLLCCYRTIKHVLRLEEHIKFQFCHESSEYTWSMLKFKIIIAEVTKKGA